MGGLRDRGPLGHPQGKKGVGQKRAESPPGERTETLFWPGIPPVGTQSPVMGFPQIKGARVLFVGKAPPKYYPGVFKYKGPPQGRPKKGAKPWPGGKFRGFRENVRRPKFLGGGNISDTRWACAQGEHWAREGTGDYPHHKGGERVYREGFYPQNGPDTRREGEKRAHMGPHYYDRGGGGTPQTGAEKKSEGGQPNKRGKKEPHVVRREYNPNNGGRKKADEKDTPQREGKHSIMWRTTRKIR